MSSSNLNTQALIQTITLAEAKDAISEMIGRWIIIGEGFVFSQKTVGAWITTTASIEDYLLKRCKPPQLTDAEFQELIVFALDKVTSQPRRLKKVEYFSFLPHGGITPAPGEHPEYRELKQMLEKQLAPNPWSGFINAESLSASFFLVAMITVASIMPAVAAVASSNELSSNDESHDVALLNPSAVATIGAIKQLALEDMYEELGGGSVVDVASYEERTTHHIFSVAESLVAFSQGWMMPESEAKLIEFLLENKKVISKLNLIFNNASNKPLLYKTIAKLSQALVVKVSGEGLYDLTFNFSPATDGRPHNSNYLIVLLGQTIMQMQKDDLLKISPDELLHMYLILQYFKMYRINEKETTVSEQINRMRAAIGPDFDRLMLKGRKASAKRLGMKVEELFPDQERKIAKKSVTEENHSATGYEFGTLLQIFFATVAAVWLAIRIKSGAFTMQGCYYAAQRLIQNLKLAQFDFDRNNECIVRDYQLLAFLKPGERTKLLEALLSTDSVDVKVNLTGGGFKFNIPHMDKRARDAYNRHLEALDFSDLEKKFQLEGMLKAKIISILKQHSPTLSKFIFTIDIVKDQGIVLTFSILDKLSIPEDTLSYFNRLSVFNREFVPLWRVAFPFDALDKDGCITSAFEKALKEIDEFSSLKLKAINKKLSLALDGPKDKGNQSSAHICSTGKSSRVAVSAVPESISCNDNIRPIEKIVGSSKALGEISRDLERLFEELILSSDSGYLILQKDESRKQIALQLDGDKYYINRPIGERSFYLSNIALRNLIKTFFINTKVPEDSIRIQTSRKRNDLSKITLIDPTSLMLDNTRFINQQQAPLFKRLSQLANIYYPMEIKLHYSDERYNVVFNFNEDNFFEIEPYGLSNSSFLRCVKQSLMDAKIAVNDIEEGNQFSVPLQDITEHKDELLNKEQFFALKKERFEADKKKELQEGKEEKKESEADKIVEENGSAGKGKHRKPKANIPHQKSTGYFFNKRIQSIGSSSSAFRPKFDEKNEATEIRRLVEVINLRLLSLKEVENEDNLLELYLVLANLLERLTKCVKQFDRVGVIVPRWFRNIQEPQNLMRLRAIVIKNLNYPNHYDFVKLVAENFCKAIVLSEAEESFSIPYSMNIDEITNDCLSKAKLPVYLEKSEDFNRLERNIDYDEIIALIEKLKSCYKQDANEKIFSKWVQCHILLVRALILRVSELFAIKNKQSPDETESKLGSTLYNVLQNARVMRNDIAHLSGQQGAPAVLEEAAFIIELSKLEKPQSSSSGPSRSRRG